MSDVRSSPEPGSETGIRRPVLDELDEAECLRLIAPGGIGRIAYSGRYGPTVLPVNYNLHQGTIVFRTAQDSPTDEYLRTGIAHAEYKVAVQIDDIDIRAKDVSSVLSERPLPHAAPESYSATDSY